MRTRPLLEREHALAELAAAIRDAADGHGSVVLVCGEAGIGKSRLVEALRGQIPAEGRLLIGHCDALVTARTLGPFRDLTGHVGAELSSALRDGADRDRILTALRTELDWPGHVTVLVIEDAHWADDATLDVLRYLVRRASGLPAVLVVTYRDDEVGADHPLRPLLGLVSGQDRRLLLAPLSPAAVRELSVGTAIDAAEVFAVTSGNPFFVTEMLAAGGAAGVSPTVVDAVLARLHNLDQATRDAVEQLSVIPSAIDRALVDALVRGGVAALSAAEERALLTVSPSSVEFRHELTRRAIVDALPAGRRIALNASVLAALVDDPDADLARVVHHATESGDLAAIRRFGAPAALAAVAAGAHREAVAHYRLVLEQGDAFPRSERAELFEGYAVECYTVGDSNDAVAAQRAAIGLRREVGDDGAVGAGLRWLSRMHWWNGERGAAETVAREAVAVLERLGDPRLLAIAYSNQAQLDMLAYRTADAAALAEAAVALARSVGDAATLSHALNNLGCALEHMGDARGLELLEEGLRVALAAGEHDHACRAYVNLASQLVDDRRLDDAARYVAGGIEHAERADHVGYLAYLAFLKARIGLARGEWDDALQVAAAGMTGQFRCPTWTVTGRIAARRGDPEARATLATAVELGRELTEFQWLAPAAAAAAECAWLRGDAAGVVADAGPLYEEACRLEARYLWPELRYWLVKAGQAPAMRRSDDPYALLAEGRWRDAADVWEAAGYRYEHAMALAESTAPADLLAALGTFDALGATPIARIVRKQLRELGVAGVPRGPALTTRHNPAGLTRRQLEVLNLLADGLSNAEIAARLVVSIRTADSHVAAVLDKLGVHSRAEAVARRAELGPTG